MDDWIRKKYELWCERATEDADLMRELQAMQDDEGRIEDAFYQDLAFGTGGLRGVIGAGTNRMNVYTVARASQGLANYVNGHFPPERRRIAVSYDSRIKSEPFARVTAGVFSANDIHVYIYPRLMPTPCLSFAVRELHCAAGVMVTASHNPAQYNGYKVYGPDGCQITTSTARDILEEIEKLDMFAGARRMELSRALEMGTAAYIQEDVPNAFLKAVRGLSVSSGAALKKDIPIVYTPLNGTGLEPVTRILRESGYKNVTLVSEQEHPDGDFPTCPYPNPEMAEAMSLGVEYARRLKAELLLATDPDCDRIAVAARDEKGGYVLLTGNETGLLLLDYICARRTADGTMPVDPVLVKTIVTTDLAEKVAAHYGVRTINVLTGFKYIGEQIGRLETAGKKESYVFGFEESCGYLSGTHVRDKDAVNGAFMICEMAAYYAAQGISLTEKLEEIYRTCGHCLNRLHSYVFEGPAGFNRMQTLMEQFRSGTGSIAGQKVEACLDYAEGLDGLPKSDVLKYRLENGATVVIRPSGTEPKLKVYISVSAESAQDADAAEKTLAASLEEAICGPDDTRRMCAGAGM